MHHTRRIRDFCDSLLRIRLALSSVLMLEEMDQLMFSALSSALKTYVSITATCRAWLRFEIRQSMSFGAFPLMFETVALAWAAVALAFAFLGAMMLGCALA